MTQVVNLFAGPGAGKSTTAAGLFHRMKVDGHSVELVTEFAKDLTYSKDFETLSNQLVVLGEQFNRMYRLVGKVDWIITDSPLLLCPMYASGPFRSAWFMGTALGAFDVFDNKNYLVGRAKPYRTEGRSQDEGAAKVIDRRVMGLLDALAVDYQWVKGDETAVDAIWGDLER